MKRTNPFVVLAQIVRCSAVSISARARAMPVRIRCEQAVYGSFADSASGYGLRGHSGGWSREQLQAFVRLCEEFGERPAHVSAEGALLCRPFGKARIIVRVRELGADNRGRPGALAFHALLLSDLDYRRIGAAPFPLVPVLKKLQLYREVLMPTLALTVVRFPASAQKSHAHRSLVDALVRGVPVAVESDAPAETLARALWLDLPARIRRRRSLATWLFSTDADYDFRAGPGRQHAYCEKETPIVTTVTR